MVKLKCGHCGVEFEPYELELEGDEGALTIHCPCFCVLWSTPWPQIDVKVLEDHKETTDAAQRHDAAQHSPVS